ncbi:hypothetical protein CBM2587_B50073 [Cupriavidus taiwanensis]|uniref:Uncharacterized protein n=1 Tax=Cupriavidus taiwanensis TaxID=164546 RepID=A0A375C4P7_9BURK|nr:hypothetical protein CBM2587_B50073 [Cupriavidus taiwanensis]
MAQARNASLRSLGARARPAGAGARARIHYHWFAPLSRLRESSPHAGHAGLLPVTDTSSPRRRGPSVFEAQVLLKVAGFPLSRE